MPPAGLCAGEAGGGARAPLPREAGCGERAPVPRALDWGPSVCVCVCVGPGGGDEFSSGLAPFLARPSREPRPLTLLCFLLGGGSFLSG